MELGKRRSYGKPSAQLLGTPETPGADATPVEYVADPSMIDVPLSAEEVAALAQNEGRDLRGDPRKVSHFLARCQATLRRHLEESRQLKSELERRRSEPTTAGQATTLSPEDAVRYLSPEQLQRVFGVVAQQQLEWMNRQRAEAEVQTKRCQKIVADVKYVLLSAAENPAVTTAAIVEKLSNAVADAEKSGAVVSPQYQPVQSPPWGQ